MSKILALSDGTVVVTKKIIGVNPILKSGNKWYVFVQVSGWEIELAHDTETSAHIESNTIVEAIKKL